MPTSSVKKHRAAVSPSKDCLYDTSFPQMAFTGSVCHKLTRNGEPHY